MVKLSNDDKYCIQHKVNTVCMLFHWSEGTVNFTNCNCIPPVAGGGRSRGREGWKEGLPFSKQYYGIDTIRKAGVQGVQMGHNPCQYIQ